VSLEQDFWEALREIAALQNTKLTKLLEKINQGRNGGNLSSAVRVFLFNHLRVQLASALASPIEEDELKDRTSGRRSHPTQTFRENERHT
jgi:predicted DNA-binding ribbon-helix-helix protein